MKGKKTNPDVQKRIIHNTQLLNILKLPKPLAEKLKQSKKEGKDHPDIYQLKRGFLVNELLDWAMSHPFDEAFLLSLLTLKDELTHVYHSQKLKLIDYVLNRKNKPALTHILLTPELFTLLTAREANWAWRIFNAFKVEPLEDPHTIALKKKMAQLFIENALKLGLKPSVYTKTTAQHGSLKHRCIAKTCATLYSRLKARPKFANNLSKGLGILQLNLQSLIRFMSTKNHIIPHLTHKDYIELNTFVTFLQSTKEHTNRPKKKLKTLDPYFSSNDPIFAQLDHYFKFIDKIVQKKENTHPYLTRSKKKEFNVLWNVFVKNIKEIKEYIHSNRYLLPLNLPGDIPQQIVAGLLLHILYTPKLKGTKKEINYNQRQAHLVKWLVDNLNPTYFSPIAVIRLFELNIFDPYDNAAFKHTLLSTPQFKAHFTSSVLSNFIKHESQPKDFSVLLIDCKDRAMSMIKNKACAKSIKLDIYTLLLGDPILSKTLNARDLTALIQLNSKALLPLAVNNESFCRQFGVSDIVHSCKQIEPLRKAIAHSPSFLRLLSPVTFHYFLIFTQMESTQFTSIFEQTLASLIESIRLDDPFQRPKDLLWFAQLIRQGCRDPHHITLNHLRNLYKQSYRKFEFSILPHFLSEWPLMMILWAHLDHLIVRDHANRIVDDHSTNLELNALKKEILSTYTQTSKEDPNFILPQYSMEKIYRIFNQLPVECFFPFLEDIQMWPFFAQALIRPLIQSHPQSSLLLNFLQEQITSFFNQTKTPEELITTLGHLERFFKAIQAPDRDTLFQSCPFFRILESWACFKTLSSLKSSTLIQNAYTSPVWMHCLMGHLQRYKQSPKLLGWTVSTIHALLNDKRAPSMLIKHPLWRSTLMRIPCARAKVQAKLATELDYLMTLSATDLKSFCIENTHALSFSLTQDVLYTRIPSFYKMNLNPIPLKHLSSKALLHVFASHPPKGFMTNFLKHNQGIHESTTKVSLLDQCTTQDLHRYMRLYSLVLAQVLTHPKLYQKIDSFKEVPHKTLRSRSFLETLDTGALKYLLSHQPSKACLITLLKSQPIRRQLSGSIQAILDQPMLLDSDLKSLATHCLAHQKNIPAAKLFLRALSSKTQSTELKNEAIVGYALLSWPSDISHQWLARIPEDDFNEKLLSHAHYWAALAPKTPEIEAFFKKSALGTLHSTGILSSVLETFKHLSLCPSTRKRKSSPTTTTIN